jgi:murein DD-endopeptidase MepM/ murein hydrolase activator NlpD
MKALRPALVAILGLVSLVSALVISDTSAAAAATALAGGVPAPSSTVTGGTSTAAAASPIVQRLSVPATSAPGSPPAVVLEILERGAPTVAATVAVHSLTTGQSIVVVQLGWIRTGRPLRVSWPRGTRLAADAYHVSVSAHDARGRSLLRTHAERGVATLTVQDPPAPAPVPAPAPGQASSAPPPAGLPTPAQTAAMGVVFPVGGPHNFGGPENRFGAPRGGYTHQGQDVLTAEGTPILAPLPGTITWTSYQAGGAGYYAVEHTSIGFDLMFAHCEAGSLIVSEGTAVLAGQQLCRAGQTGDATTPHLHFEMWVGGWQAPGGYPIDPLPYLEAWEHPVP